MQLFHRKSGPCHIASFQNRPRQGYSMLAARTDRKKKQSYYAGKRLIYLLFNFKKDLIKRKNAGKGLR